VYFLGTCPALDLFLSIKGVVDVFVVFEPDEAVALITRRETGNTSRSVFVCSARNTIRYAAVQNAGAAGNDVNVVVVVALAHRWLRYTRSALQIPPLRFAPVGMTKFKAFILKKAS
jgi:hypothetical protein